MKEMNTQSKGKKKEVNIAKSAKKKERKTYL